MTRIHSHYGIALLFAILIAFPSGGGELEETESRLPSLNEIKANGARTSSYLDYAPRSGGTQAPTPDLLSFEKQVRPILASACVACHGADLQEGNIRIDTLDPDLFHGADVDWWVEVLAVLSNGEMPPPDESELADKDRGKIVEWLSKELHIASTVRRVEGGHSSFRRMTRYEYNHTLQDLLGLPFEFAKDLPPEATSEDGFQNSSENLRMSAVQFRAYRDASRKALKRAVFRGEEPKTLFWSVSMKLAAEDAWQRQNQKLDEIMDRHKDDFEQQAIEVDRQVDRFKQRPRSPYYVDGDSGRIGKVEWRYPGARYAWDPEQSRVEAPLDVSHVAVIPARQKLIVELGDQIPESGTMRVRVRASRTSLETRVPSLQLAFGWQASNDSQATVRISEQDLAIDAAPGEPQFYQWDVALSEIYPRNSVRGISKMGDLPSPSEYIRLVNNSASNAEIQVDFVEVMAPVYEQWPPESHRRIFFSDPQQDDEVVCAEKLLTEFMTRAWRRRVTKTEIDQKLSLFRDIRPVCDDFQSAIVEVLATVLSSPKFLYLVRTETLDESNGSATLLSQDDLATRLSMFLWSSTPDRELMDLAAAERLSDTDVLLSQVRRMLLDSRSHRFSEHFTRQWLGLQLLDYLDVDRKVYPRFNRILKEAMQEEPIAFFHEVLQRNHSVLDFVHADYTMANERLARHYELNGIYGNHFRRVEFEPQQTRGGLLTLAGLLAMNSDGKDSHPLKRGIWMLERLLNDPPPPPPPAVPEIDLADPEIAKLSLKERIEDHRNQAACLSCHQKIDPWGIAFENFDAVGGWRTEIDGQPVDATSTLFNGQKLNGMDGLKRFVLENRQDQFVRALVYKMSTYALGRPLTFGDRSSIDQITADLRKQGDGLATMVEAIVASELFRTR